MRIPEEDPAEENGISNRRFYPAFIPPPTVNERLACSARPGRADLIAAQARELLNLRRLPAMLSAGQVAALLDGGSEHNIPVMVRAGLLKPLGEPPANAMKYFATVEVLQLAGDPERLHQIRRVIYEHWRGKNVARSRSDRDCRGVDC